MKPTLVVLAAGMGSRYGSLKQMDGVGPNNEAIIDYSIYDAMRAGFGKVVFIIRHWGTCHAVMMAAPVVDTPFAVINSDDFYGREGYGVLADYLRSVEGQRGKYSMVGYSLHNTLSDYGTVSRGECSVNAEGNLTSIVERTAIQRMPDGKIVYKEGDGLHELAEDTVVSMNLFGFTPDFFAESETLFKKFLSDPANMANPKAEFFIPLCVNTLINENKVSLKVLNSDAQWFGVTYKQDKPYVVERIKKLIDTVLPSEGPPHYVGPLPFREPTPSEGNTVSGAFNQTGLRDRGHA